MAVNGDEIIHGGFVNIGKLVTNGMTVNYSSKIIVPFEPEEPNEPSEEPSRNNNTIRIVFGNPINSQTEERAPLIYIGIKSHDGDSVGGISRFYTSNDFNKVDSTDPDDGGAYVETELNFQYEYDGESYELDDRPVWEEAFTKIPSDVNTEITFVSYIDIIGTKYQELEFENGQNITAIIIPDYIDAKTLDLRNFPGIKNVKVPSGCQVIR